jgi:hypothetical protein
MENNLILLRAMPTALDLWIIVSVVLPAFDKPVPWVVWVFMGLELITLLRVAGDVKKEKQDGRL